MKIQRNFSLCLVIAIVLICSSSVRSGPTRIGVSDDEDTSYMWCDDIDEENKLSESETETAINTNRLADVEDEPPGYYELLRVLS